VSQLEAAIVADYVDFALSIRFMSIGIEKEANIVAVYPSDKTVITNIHKIENENE
jgi:predicted ATP-binding protein involved in virulence